MDGVEGRVAVGELEDASDCERGGVRHEAAPAVVENEVIGLYSGEVVERHAGERDDDVGDSAPVRADQEILQALDAVANLRVGGVLDLPRRRYRTGRESHDPFQDTESDCGTGLQLRPAKTSNR